MGTSNGDRSVNVTATESEYLWNCLVSETGSPLCRINVTVNIPASVNGFKVICTAEVCEEEYRYIISYRIKESDALSKYGLPKKYMCDFSSFEAFLAKIAYFILTSAKRAFNTEDAKVSDITIMHEADVIAMFRNISKHKFEMCFIHTSLNAKSKKRRGSKDSLTVAKSVKRTVKPAQLLSLLQSLNAYIMIVGEWVSPDRSEFCIMETAISLLDEKGGAFCLGDSRLRRCLAYIPENVTEENADAVLYQLLSDLESGMRINVEVGGLHWASTYDKGYYKVKRFDFYKRVRKSNDDEYIAAYALETSNVKDGRLARLRRLHIQSLQLNPEY